MWLLLLLQVLGPSPSPSPTEPQLELRVGVVRTFGADSQPGTEPFAQLRTVSTLRGPVRLLTWTRLTGVAGTEFALQRPETVRALEFELGLAWRAPGWRSSILLLGGAQAQAWQELEEGEEAPPAVRRLGAGLLLDSTSRTWLILTGGWDERQPGGWGLQVGGGAEVAPGITMIGTGLLGKRTGFRLAMAAGWK